MINQTINKSISEASQVIGKTWPLYSFVTSNPLSGYEKKPFFEAVNHAEKRFNAQVYPEVSLFREAWERGYIHKERLNHLLKENDFLKSPEYYLEQMNNIERPIGINANNDLDRFMTKWLAAFMDEGLAEWDMPNKEKGFYEAWRKLVIYDQEIPKTSIAEIPKTPGETVESILNGFSESDILEIFKQHLAALPGWTGYINYRCESNSEWQQKYPITLIEYLAVRLWTAQKINAQIHSKTNDELSNPNISKLQYIWLKAWEKGWQVEMEKLISEQQLNTKSIKNLKQQTEAQMVFCIDTRSELIRRHIENKGNYETFGYAGFFGIAMDYEDLNNGIIRKSCPPIVKSAYHVNEVPQENCSEEVEVYKKKNEHVKFKNYFLKRLKNMLPSAFGFVEGSGGFYGLYMIFRTLLPEYLLRFKKLNSRHHESIFQTEIHNSGCETNDTQNIPLREKVAIVKSGFDLMGWKDFAPLVVFVGHGSHSANNPFGSSLDCGACAASPGRHNARMLAKLANMSEVKQVLRENHNIEIPPHTIFVGAEHNTTTDEIVLFDAEVPSSHFEELQKLKSNLEKARQTATQERLGVAQNSIALANKKANNWGETRPEWGLAKNAGFIVGPRNLTKHANLEGRCFLHSYDWETDKEGAALEAIMQGPVVVTQWINNHYYFSTVNNETFGGGSKITHNVTGKFGVVQGNGGDLKMGLPLQSLMQSDSKMYHQPLRLSVVIQAPLSRVSSILVKNENLKSLLDNEWIYLLVMDPADNNKWYQYERNLNWLSTKVTQSVEKDLDYIIQEEANEVLV
ncbi:DUF2309 domain-containing protein [Gaetbulibacter saemankumensis]|uniref:DUF2309 domain-containing protein n=1 Tax=Gaetbulibacter saemankumensis TaxID=311208 RepID=UPI000409EF87|nr:DUF2309 domain-containing protein [Gaetbulibacter saemankumensis]